MAQFTVTGGTGTSRGNLVGGQEGCCINFRAADGSDHQYWYHRGEWCRKEDGEYVADDTHWVHDGRGWRPVTWVRHKLPAFSRGSQQLPADLQLSRAPRVNDPKSVDRARVWLISRLTPFQREQLRRHGKYAVKGNLAYSQRKQRGWGDRGGWYCVDLRESNGHVISDMYGNHLCVHAQGYPHSPYMIYNKYDSALAVTIRMRSDEAAFLQKARVTHGYYHDADPVIVAAIRAEVNASSPTPWYRRLFPW